MTLAIDAPATLTPAETAALESHEAVIERGLQTFYEVGTALLAIRDGRLYREGYPTFEAYCRERWDISKTQANRLIQSADVVTNLTPIGVIPETESQARPLTALEPEAQRIVWEVVQKTAPAGKVTAAHVQSVASVFKEVVTTGALDDGSGEQIKVADVVRAAVTEETYERMMRQEMHVAEKLERKEQRETEKTSAREALHSSATNEWYTPPQYIEAARQLMGAIDLDPASHELANTVVQAATFYTESSNGLTKDWTGCVWLNPPYGRDEDNDSNQDVWSARLIAQYEAGITREAVLLVNAATDRKWFHRLWTYPICFTDHRIRFIDADGVPQNRPTNGNAFVYFGQQRERFIALFSPFGTIVERAK